MKSSGDKALFKKSWQKLVDELKSNFQNDPYSKTGIDLGKKYMDWVNSIYGKNFNKSTY